MKKVVIIAAVAVMAAATVASAASIRNTKHDLSASSTGGITSNSAELCVFCHTPHNSRPGYPLWNRTLPAAGGFQLYSTQSMKNAKAGASAGFSANSISLYCMSCHDGGLVGGRITNPPNATPSVALVDVAGEVTADKITNANMNLGASLMNDHPVNFDVTYTGAGFNNVNLVAHTMGTNNLPLFASDGKSNRLECASCHNVHDNAFSPFLREANTGSALCLDCHNK